MIPMEPDGAANPAIMIQAQGTFDLDVDVLKASGQIDHDVLSVDIGKRAVGR